MENKPEVLSKKSQKLASRQIAIAVVLTALVVSSLVFVATFFWAFKLGQNDSWDLICINEEYLFDLYRDFTQRKLREHLPDIKMNFTEGLIWESNLLEYTQNSNYLDVVQVLNNRKGGCEEFVWVFAAFCVANGIPVRVVTLGYFNPGVIDHFWAQVNPSNDSKTWTQVEVADTCVRLRNGETISDLWNVTINNNAYYINRNYKLVLAYEWIPGQGIVITDVTGTFSRYWYVRGW